MKDALEHMSTTWEELGKKDPLWAVVTHPGKRGERWNQTEFMDTGVQDVAYYHQLITRHIPTSNVVSHVLDFGCGVGRLTCAWSKHAKQATGVDISSSMLEVAKKNAGDRKNLHFVLNQRKDLRIFKNCEFDLVFSLICLQHIPWTIAADYIREFARVCKGGGVVAFQLPSREINPDQIARLRKWIIEHLPFGAGRLYRRWRHGTSALFDMHYTPRQQVESVATGAGLKLVGCELDTAAGSNVESFFYIFKKPDTREIISRESSSTEILQKTQQPSACHS